MWESPAGPHLGCKNSIAWTCMLSELATSQNLLLPVKEKKKKEQQNSSQSVVGNTLIISMLAVKQPKPTRQFIRLVFFIYRKIFLFEIPQHILLLGSHFEIV